MEYLIMLGLALALMIGVQFTREKETMRITWLKVAEFMAFMVMVTLFRIYFIDFGLSTGLIERMPTLPLEISTNKWTLGLVWWEDMIFGFPIYLLAKYVDKKWLKWPLIVAISLMFGSGHAYQGMWAVALTSLYPYFISKKYGEKHGFGTVMLCHIMYDSFTTFGVLLLPYLL